MAIALFSCANSPEKSARERFEQHKKQNIAKFADIAVATHQMDVNTAKVYADSLLEYLYRIDSTYVMADGQENELFLKENGHKALKYYDSIFLKK